MRAMAIRTDYREVYSLSVEYGVRCLNAQTSTAATYALLYVVPDDKLGDCEGTVVNLRRQRFLKPHHTARALGNHEFSLVCER